MELTAKIEYNKMKNDSFTCIFQGSYYPIDFTPSVENLIKRLTNKIKA